MKRQISALLAVGLLVGALAGCSGSAETANGVPVQTVAIARAIVGGPKLLLADEPTGALDSQSGKQVMELFHQLNREGITIIMITHALEIAAQARKRFLIQDGVLQEEATAV